MSPVHSTHHSQACDKNKYTGAECTCGLDSWASKAVQIITPTTSQIAPGCYIVIPMGVTVVTNPFIPFTERQALGWSD